MVPLVGAGVRIVHVVHLPLKFGDYMGLASYLLTPECEAW